MSQLLPPWYTLSTINGPTPSTTLLYLPLTYYGPSIPLDSDWTYGGLSSPVSTQIATQMTVTTPVTTPVTTTFVTTITSVITPTATPTPTPTPTATPTSTPTSLTPFSHHTLSKNALIGVILGAILGSVFLIFLFLLFLRWRVRRRNPQGDPNTIFSFETPVWAEWHMVNAEDPSAEASGRHSRDEAGPFLAGPDPGPSTPGPSATASTAVPMQQRNVKRVTVPPTVAPEVDLNDSDTSSNNSGYGTLIEPPSPPAHYEDRRGHIIPPTDLVKLHQDDGDPVPLLPPPRLVDATRPGRASYVSHASSTDTEDVPALFTARRVRVHDLGPRISPVREDQEPSLSTASQGGWAGGLAAGLGRLSWFKNTADRRSQSPQRPSSWFGRFTETEHEASRSLLGADYKRPRPLSLNVVSGERPPSSVSARSGNTIYYDAASLPSLPSPLPRALTPQSPPGYDDDTAFAAHMHILDTAAVPPAHTHILDTHSPTQSNLNMTLPPGTDVLDLPAPPPLSPFASTSTTSSSTRALSPPGLATPKAWLDTDATPSLTRTDSTDPITVSVDVLEQDPPAAGAGWRTLAAAGAVAGGGRRETFGSPRAFAFAYAGAVGVRTPRFVSAPAAEHAEVYGAYLSPAQSSAGSRSPSHSHSHSSGPSGHSGHSAGLTVSSSHSHSSGGAGAGGVSRAGSITSDGRRRRRRGVVSPTLSAFGPREHGEGRPRSPFVVGEDGEEEEQLSPLMYFPDMPWAAGL